MITAEEVLFALIKHTNVLLYGQPGTGKSHLMKQVQNLFESTYSGGKGTQLFVDTTAERTAITEEHGSGAHSRWVTFHQGYSYEDFIIGLRPISSSKGSSTLSIEPRAGALLELAAQARDGYGLMIVDEINRGNASRIFGEFITLMEPDKRLREDGSVSDTTVTISLPYLAPGSVLEVEKDITVEQQFRMPQRVYTLASMNSVDKSVAPLDAAIRRRFYVINMRPDKVDLEIAAGLTAGKEHPVARLAVQVFQSVNRSISLYLGPDYMLGQYYLPAEQKLADMEEGAAKKTLIDLWRHKIIPQLLEFFQSRPGVCDSVLRLKSTKGEPGVEIIQPTDAEADEGAGPYIINISSSTSDDKIMEFLESLVGIHKGAASVAEPEPSSE